MSLSIAGMGWVTPLGSGLAGVWERLVSGDTAAAESISSPLGQAYAVFPVPAAATAQAPGASAIASIQRDFAVRGSRWAGCAGRRETETRRGHGEPRTALIFAVSNGGVIYTKRFYDEIVESGSQAASPLLFPETVFNAPASHLAAILGISGASYTLVGDGAVGILALKMAEDLMWSEMLDHCLVVGAEEADWLLCDAYRKWRLLRSTPPIEPFGTPPRGTILSEGAGAILLSRQGPIQLARVAAGTNFRKQSEAGDAVDKIFGELCEGETDLVVASANGTFVDAAEQAAIKRHCPSTKVLAIKGALGESVGASSLWQTICGAQSLRTQLVPADLPYPAEVGSSLPAGQLRRAVVSVCGLNQQVAGLRIERS